MVLRKFHVYRSLSHNHTFLFLSCLFFFSVFNFSFYSFVCLKHLLVNSLFFVFFNNFCVLRSFFSVVQTAEGWVKLFFTFFFLKLTSRSFLKANRFHAGRVSARVLYSRNCGKLLLFAFFRLSREKVTRRRGLGWFGSGHGRRL